MTGAELLLLLEIQVAPGREHDLLAFLAEAFPFYEAQGGRMALFRDETQPGSYLELATYATQEEYDRVERLVREDAETRAVLERWRSLLAAPPRVRAFRRVPVPAATGKGPLG
jgi:hypothetical protein